MVFVYGSFLKSSNINNELNWIYVAALNRKHNRFNRTPKLITHPINKTAFKMFYRLATQNQKAPYRKKKHRVYISLNLVYMYRKNHVFYFQFILRLILIYE